MKKSTDSQATPPTDEQIESAVTEVEDRIQALVNQANENASKLVEMGDQVEKLKLELEQSYQAIERYQQELGSKREGEAIGLAWVDVYKPVWLEQGEGQPPARKVMKMSVTSRSYISPLFAQQALRAAVRDLASEGWFPYNP